MDGEQRSLKEDRHVAISEYAFVYLVLMIIYFVIQAIVNR